MSNNTTAPAAALRAISGGDFSLAAYCIDFHRGRMEFVYDPDKALAKLFDCVVDA